MFQIRVSRTDEDPSLEVETRRHINKTIYKSDVIENIYRGADKSLARPTSRCILFDDGNSSIDASLVIYINSTNIPPIMIINRIYETQNLLSL
jgi:hypothetical protein